MHDWLWLLLLNVVIDVKKCCQHTKISFRELCLVRQYTIFQTFDAEPHENDCVTIDNNILLVSVCECGFCICFYFNVTMSP